MYSSNVYITCINTKSLKTITSKSSITIVDTIIVIIIIIIINIYCCTSAVGSSSLVQTDWFLLCANDVPRSWSHILQCFTSHQPYHWQNMNFTLESHTFLWFLTISPSAISSYWIKLFHQPEKKQLCCKKITLYNSHPLITIIMAWILRIIDHYLKKYPQLSLLILISYPIPIQWMHYC